MAKAKDFIIASVTADDQFARKLAKFCGVNSHIDEAFNPVVFSGGEFCPVASNEVKGKRVYLVATPNPKGADPQDPGGAQDLFARILISVDALKRNGAREVWLIYTDMHYSRQDRGPQDVVDAGKMKGQPFNAMVQAKHFKLAGVDKIITIHPHSKKLYKVYGGAWLGLDEYDRKWSDPEVTKKLIEKGKQVLIGLNPAPIVAHYLLHKSTIAKNIAKDGSNLVFLVPDAGARSFADDVKKHTFLPKAWLIQCNKIRKAPNDPSQVEVDIAEWPEGLCLDKTYLLLVDDGSETGGTLVNAALAMSTFKQIRGHENIGTPVALIAYITHPWLNGPYNRITQQKLAGIKGMQEIIVGNTWTYIDDSRVARFKEISTVVRFAQYFAQAIHCFEQGMSIDEYFSFKNRKELDKHVPELYAIKRSEMWGLEKKSWARPIKRNGKH